MKLPALACSCLGLVIVLYILSRMGFFANLSTGLFEGPAPGFGGGGGGFPGFPGVGGSSGGSDPSGSWSGGGDINVTFQAGMGSGGKHAFHKSFKGSPFPLRNGALATFEIQFAPGFEWSCGGKIGGFEIGSGPASGCRHSPKGASHRFNFESNNSAKAYVYVPDGTYGQQPGPLQQRNNCGNGVFEGDFRGVFSEGKWHSVQVAVKLNAPGRSDGRIMLSVDGRARTLDGVVMRTGADMNIVGFQFGMFHGGGCKATKTSQLSIRNLKFSSWG